MFIKYLCILCVLYEWKIDTIKSYSFIRKQNKQTMLYNMEIILHYIFIPILDIEYWQIILCHTRIVVLYVTNTYHPKILLYVRTLMHYSFYCLNFVSFSKEIRGFILESRNELQFSTAINNIVLFIVFYLSNNKKKNS